MSSIAADTEKASAAAGGLHLDGGRPADSTAGEGEEGGLILDDELDEDYEERMEIEDGNEDDDFGFEHDDETGELVVTLRCRRCRAWLGYGGEMALHLMAEGYWRSPGLPVPLCEECTDTVEAASEAGSLYWFVSHLDAFNITFSSDPAILPPSSLPPHLLHWDYFDEEKKKEKEKTIDNGAETRACSRTTKKQRDEKGGEETRGGKGSSGGEHGVSTPSSTKSKAKRGGGSESGTDNRGEGNRLSQPREGHTDDNNERYDLEWHLDRAAELIKFALEGKVRRDSIRK